MQLRSLPQCLLAMAMAFWLYTHTRGEGGGMRALAMDMAPAPLNQQMQQEIVNFLHRALYACRLLLQVDYKSQVKPIGNAVKYFASPK